MIDTQGLENLFQNPSMTYRPQPFWFLNHDYKPELLRSQLQEMSEKGVGGVVLHSRHGKTEEYFSDAYFDMLETCIEECIKLGMQTWLYDEDNWPSGTFGGKLTQQFPEYRMRYLRVEEKRYSSADGQQECLIDFALEDGHSLISILAYRIKQQDGDTVILQDNPQDLTPLYDGSWQPKEEGDFVILVFWECEVAEKVTFARGYYLDTMNPEAVNKFIELGYGPFDRLSAHFGKNIQGVFTDEPGLMIHDGFGGVEAIKTSVEHLDRNLPGMILAWTRNLPERFEQHCGYSLTSNLGSLLYQVEETSHKVREDYYAALTYWYIDAYHRGLHSWCEARGLAYIGHTLEEPIWGQARSQGNQTQVLREFDYPGVDYLQAGIGTKENPYRILSVKCASSVAHLEGKERVICEAFGASDHGYSMRQRRLDANFMAFLGVNLFIPHAFYYSFEGYRKTDFPQTEFYHAPHWEHYHVFADYIARLSLMGSLGHHNAHILLLSPVHTVYQEMFENGMAELAPTSDVLHALLSDRLIRNQLDYDYLDDSQLTESLVAQGNLTFAKSRERYRAVILPGMKVMSVASAAKLNEFVQGGGLLVAIGEVPSHSFNQADDPVLKEYLKPLFPHSGGLEWHEYGQGKTLFLSELKVTADDARYLCEQLSLFPGVDQFASRWFIPEAEKERVIVSCRLIEEKLYYWVMNWSEVSAEIQCLVKPLERVEEWKLENGERILLAQRESNEFRLEPGELRIVSVVESDSQKVLEPFYSIEKTIELPAAWEFELEDPNVKILDRWEVIFNDRESRMNAVMPGQTNTYRTRIMINASAVGKEMSLVTDDIDQYVPSHIGFLSRRRSVEIYINGHRLPALEPAGWQDHFYKSVNLTPYVHSGENVIELLTISLLEPMIRVASPLFLIGDFALNEEGVVISSHQPITGYWSEQGYPHLSGKADYMQSFMMSDIKVDEAQQFELELENVRESASVLINGQFVGTRLWPPYRWDITKALRPGSNEIRIQVANTLANLYGKEVLPSGLSGKGWIHVKTLTVK
ncbi:glycosyl hydrolase [Paenibacillus monticola]|uniref:Beta-galactosidase n=1 Tax=Paenibacillus monticola TaxID=2666075 RepID=A0A7X2H715_9BACL|nr:glycosyl hydrolase [Paenibacillus monticola]MRN54694.1 beta-galactosidase [Paenibacillus monticola]